MAVAAELEALPAVRPGPVGLDPERGRVAGHRVLLAAQVRDPEGVDDVLRAQLHLHLHAGRDVELLACHEVRPVRQAEGVLLRVGERPAPLLPDRLHGHAGVAVDRVDVVELLPREHREADDHEGGHDRPGELEHVVAVELLRDVPRPLAEFHSGVDERAGDDREHDHRAREQDPVHESDLRGDRTSRIEGPRTHRARD